MIHSDKIIKIMIGLVGWVSTVAMAQSNIDPDHKFAFSEEGWTNWRDADSGAEGVRVESTYLSGYVWTGVGWVDVGQVPANAVSYSNLDHTDYGVNIAPNGDLSGFAWSGVGWINFDTSSVAPDHARFDSGVGRFRGFAWGETAWINLDHETHFVAKARPDVIPTVSEWGLVVLTLVLMTAATVVLGRQRKSAAA